MPHREGENGNQRRTREAFEKLVCSSPEVIEEGNRNVERWRYWIVVYAKRFRWTNRHLLAGVPLAELVGAAALGMVKASRTWTEAEGAFSGWAWYGMRKEMQKLLDHNGDGFLPFIEDDRGNVVEVMDTACGPDEEAEEVELAAIVVGLVEELPYSQREAIRDWQDGLPASQTANRLGISIHAVYRDRASAIAWIKSRVADEEIGTTGSDRNGEVTGGG